jgi:hypothetical protein
MKASFLAVRKGCRLGLQFRKPGGDQQIRFILFGPLLQAVVAFAAGLPVLLVEFSGTRAMLSPRNGQAA